LDGGSGVRSPIAAAGDATMLRKVLVGVDGTPGARDAVVLARTLATADARDLLGRGEDRRSAVRRLTLHRH